MKTNMFALLGCLITATVLTLGCLIKDEFHALYLEPDGSVTWTILEKDVRSDSADPGTARQEEEEFLDQARTGDQPAASSLRELSPDSLHTRILRDERPYTVITEARFASVDSLARSILARMELRGSVELQTAGGITRLVVKLYPRDEPPDGEETADSSAGAPASGDGSPDGSSSQDIARRDPPPLSEDLKAWKVMLTRGKFVEGHGFRLSADRQEAYLLDLSVGSQGEPDGALVYTLAWTDGESR